MTKKHRSGSTKQRVSFGANPNDPSDSEPDVNMNKRRAHSEGESEPENESKRSRSERKKGVKPYDSPTNRAIREKQRKGIRYEPYGREQSEEDETESKKGKGRSKGRGEQKGGKKGHKGKGVRNFFPAPDHDDPIVKMQMQMEICKMKSERRMTLEVSKVWFTQIRQVLIEEKTDESVNASPRVVEECTKKAFLWYIQSWLARDEMAKVETTTEEEAEEVKDRKSYLVKIKELLIDLRRCEIQAMISGYNEIRTWSEDTQIFTIHGNPGCEIWFRRIIDISKTGKIWELNESGKYLKATKSEEDYQQISRRFGRYKRARAEALAQIKREKGAQEQEVGYIGWKEVHSRVEINRQESGYSSEQEEGQYQERKGASGKKGSKGGKKGSKGQKGKQRTSKGDKGEQGSGY